MTLQGDQVLLRTAARALVASMGREAAIARQLQQQLELLRTAVATADADTLEAATLAVGRIALALDEARRQRGALVRQLGGSDDLTLSELDSSLPAECGEEFRQARASLRAAAEAAAREASIAQRVLRRAIASGDAFLQQLFSVSAPPGTTPESSGALLLDRTV
jgi:hypothetical protein